MLLGTNHLEKRFLHLNLPLLGGLEGPQDPNIGNHFSLEWVLHGFLVKYLKPPYSHSITQDILGLVISPPYIHFTGGLARKMAGNSDKNSFQEPAIELKDSSNVKGSSEGFNP